MNIFYLHNDTKLCAEQHVDKHVVKMIVEYAQLLSTAHRMIDGEEYIGKSKTGRKVKRYRMTNPNLDKTVYLAVHYHHPSAVWARETKSQYEWLYSLFVELGKEYTHRYGKIHSTNALLNDILSNAPKNIKQEGWREPPPAMQHYPQCIVQGDSIQSYKNYYNEAKAYFAKWSKREQPEWFIGSMT
jgi:ssDNA-specific exonuclease RecJ